MAQHVYEDALVSISVMNAVKFAERPPAKQWIVDGLLPVGTSVLYGAPGSGKSFLALNLAGAVALGKPFLGKFPVRQGMVLYITLEGEDIQSRVYLWRKQNNVHLTAEDKARLRAKFHSAEDYEKEPPQDEKKERVYFAKEAQDEQLYERELYARPEANLLILKGTLTLSEDKRPEDDNRYFGDVVDEIEKMRKQMGIDWTKPKPIVLIVIDTLSRATGGEVDENTQIGMQKIVRGVERLRAELAFPQTPSVLLLHHTRGDGEKMRGNNALPADVDAKLRLEIAKVAGKEVDPEAPVVPLILEIEKNRQGQSVKKLRLEKRALPLIDSPEEEEAVLQHENNIRAKAGEPLLERLEHRESCIIELADNGGGVDAPATRFTSKPRVPRNVQKLLNGLKALGGSCDNDAQLASASALPKGSLFAAKQAAEARGFVTLNDSVVTLKAA